MDMLISMTTFLMIFTKNAEAFARMGYMGVVSRSMWTGGIPSCVNRSTRHISTLHHRKLSTVGSSTGISRSITNGMTMVIDKLPNRKSLQPLSSIYSRSSPSHVQALYSTSNSGSDGSDGRKDIEDPIIQHSLELEISTIEDMEDVGAVLSVGAMGGDILTLDGDLGAGKTCFSRGFVRASTGVSDLRVTSPTYLLSNTYPAGEDLTIHHMDLYRLSEGEDFGPLNLPFVFEHCISLIEWPSRLGDLMPEERLEINFQIDRVDSTGDDEESEEHTRYLRLTPHGDRWMERIKQIENDGYLDDMIVEYEDYE